METFDIINPSPLLVPYIKYYWILEAEHTDGVIERTIPTGNMHLIFHKGGKLFSSGNNEWQPRSFLCGQTVSYSDLSSSGNVSMIAVVFQPYGAKAFFSMPMNEFRQMDVSIDDLHDKELKELESRLLDTEDNIKSIQLIEAFFIRRLYNFKTYNYKRVGSVIGEINKMQADLDIRSLAGIACLSYKQFNRIFTEYVGTSPKEFTRIVRFQRALFILQTEKHISFTELAYLCGFSDQSHLIKEFKTLSGYTPGEYLAACNPYSDYFANP